MKYHKLYETWNRHVKEEEISETALARGRAALGTGPTAENVGDLEKFLGMDLSAIGEEAISKIKDKVLGWVDEIYAGRPDLQRDPDAGPWRPDLPSFEGAEGEPFREEKKNDKI